MKIGVLCVPGAPDISHVLGIPMGIGIPGILMISVVPGVTTSKI